MNAPADASLLRDTGEPLVDVRLHAHRFGSHTVLGPIRFALFPGEVVAVLGPSGCGKSTLLRIVAGLEPAQASHVNVHGHAPTKHGGRTGFVFQEPRLLPWLTVAENVGFAAGLRGNAALAHPHIQALLAEVGLIDAAALLPKALSGGMAQRAAIARGLFTDPPLLLLDEPFSALDPFTRMRLQDLLLQIAARHGTTLLLVTHDVDEALYLADRVLILEPGPGRIVADLRVGLPRAFAGPAVARSRQHERLAALRAEIFTHLGTAA